MMNPIPQGVAWMYQALDFEPLDPFLPQYTIPRPAGTQGHTITYQLPHPKIGYSGLVNADLFADARQAHVAFQS